MPSKARRRGHDEGSIYQRESDGRWVAVVDAGYINGRRRRFTGYGETRKDATDVRFLVKRENDRRDRFKHHAIT